MVVHCNTYLVLHTVLQVQVQAEVQRVALIENRTTGTFLSPTYPPSQNITIALHTSDITRSACDLLDRTDQWGGACVSAHVECCSSQ